MSRQLQSLVTFQSSTGKYNFSSSNFNSFCSLVNTASVGIDKRPLGVIAVFGRHKKLLTDWLIHFYSGESGSIGNPKTPRFLPAETIENGLYFWPDLFQPCQSLSDDRIFLILYIQGMSESVHKLALSVCSQAIVFGKEEKEKYEKLIINSLDWSKAGRVEILDICSSSTTTETPASDTVFNILGNLSIPVKLTWEESPVQLGTFMSYFDVVLEHLASRRPPSTRDAKDDKESGRSTMNADPKNENFREQVSSLPSSKAELLPVADGSIAQNDQTDKLAANNESTKDKSKAEINPPGSLTSSTQHFDTTIHIKILSTLNDWLSVQTSPWKPSSLRAPLQPFISPEEDYFKELEQVLELVDTFGSELHNMFDNYVCFYGKDDTKQLDNFIQTTWSRTMEDFRKSQFQFKKILFALCQDACAKLSDIYSSHNAKITKYELRLALIVQQKCMQTMQLILSEHSKNSESADQLFKIYTNLQKALISLMANCMEHDGKLNYVHTEASKKLENMMKNEFEKVSLKFRKPLVKQKSPILQGIFLYQKSLSPKVYENPIAFNISEIRNFHKDKTAELISNLKLSDDAENIQYILYGHLKYILSKRCEQEMINSLGPDKNKQGKTLCIYLTPDHFRMDIMTDKGLEPIIYKPENSPWCPALCVVDDKNETRAGFGARLIIHEKKGKVLGQGFIYNFITNSINNEEKSVDMLLRLFKLLKAYSEKTFSLSVTNCIILVPGFYNLKCLERIKNGSKGAGFLETYVVGEGSIIASEIFKADQNMNFDLAVAIEVGPEGVFVEIYRECVGEGKMVQMVAQNFTSWSSVEDWKDPENVLNICNKSSWVNMIGLAYNRAIDLVSESLRDNIKYCFLLTGYADWENAFDDYFKLKEKVVVVKNARDTYGVLGAGRLSLEVRQIREKIQDYLRVDVGESMSGSDEKSGENLENVEQVEGVKEDSKESEEVIGRKQVIIKTCEMIKEKIDSGEVKVSRLLLKNINETLKRAVEVATNEFSSSKELEDEETEIAELITEHNF